MTVVSWLRDISPLALSVGASGGPEDARASFQPDFGAPIERRRTTAAVKSFEVSLTPVNDSQYAAFETWFDATTQSGALRFCFRDPLGGNVVLARFIEPYVATRVAAARIAIRMRLMVLPSAPWFAPYVRAGLAEIPAFVADYGAGVYGIGADIKVAGDMPAIAGTYDLYTTDDSNVETLQASKVVLAGDIAATKPAGVKIYVGFTP